MNFLRNPDKLIYILLIVCAAFYVTGIWYGLPYFFIGDEPSLIGGALKMIQLKNPIPALDAQSFKMLYYPPLIPYIFNLFFVPILFVYYLTGHFGNLINFQDYLVLSPSILIIIARIISALFGVALVFLTYKISKSIFKNSWAAFYGALLLAFGYYQNQLSHFARHWIFTAFFAYLILYFAVKITQENKTKWYIWAALFTGLSFGTSYVGVIFAIFVLTAHFWRGFKLTKDIILYFVVSAAVSLLFSFLYPQVLLGYFSGSGGREAGTSLVGFLNSVYYFGKVLVEMELPLVVFSLIGLIHLGRKREQRYFLYPLLFFIFFYPALLYFIFHNEPRYIFILIPALAIVGGMAINFIIEKLNNLQVNYGRIACFLVILLPFIIGARYNFLLTRKDTRILAKEWILKNIPDKFNVLVNFSQLSLPRTKESILDQKVLKEDSLRQSESVLLRQDILERPQYFVINMRFIENDNEALYKLKSWHTFDYLILERQINSSLTETEKNLTQGLSKLKVFNQGDNISSEDFTGNFVGNLLTLFKIKNFGPEVDIYKL